ncbi:MAG: hypothetical protein ACHQUC_03650 [Chlamydiales bacterium]
MITERYHLINIGFWTPDREVEKHVENPWIRKMVSFSEEFFSCFSSQMCEKKRDPLTNNVTVVRIIRENEKKRWQTTALRVLSLVAGFGLLILGIKLAYRWTYNIQLPFVDKVDYLKQKIQMLRNKIESLKNEIDHLIEQFLSQEVIRKMNSLLQAVTNLNSRNLSELLLSEQAEPFNAEIQRLRNEIESFSRIIESELKSHEKIYTLNQSIHSLKEEIEDLQGRLLFGASEKITELRGAFEKLKHDSERKIQEQMKTMERERQERAGERENATRAIETMTQERESTIQTYQERARIVQEEHTKEMERERQERAGERENATRAIETITQERERIIQTYQERARIVQEEHTKEMERERVTQKQERARERENATRAIETITQERERIIQTYQERARIVQKEHTEEMERERYETGFRMMNMEKEMNDLRATSQNLARENEALKQKMAMLLQPHIENSRSEAICKKN